MSVARIAYLSARVLAFCLWLYACTREHVRVCVRFVCDVDPGGGWHCLACFSSAMPTSMCMGTWGGMIQPDNIYSPRTRRQKPAQFQTMSPPAVSELPHDKQLSVEELLCDYFIFSSLPCVVIFPVVTISGSFMKYMNKHHHPGLVFDRHRSRIAI